MIEKYILSSNVCLTEFLAFSKRGSIFNALLQSEEDFML